MTDGAEWVCVAEISMRSGGMPVASAACLLISSHTALVVVDAPGGVSLAGDGPVVRSGDDHDWWVYSSDAGTMLHAFEIPDLWKQWGIVRGAVVRPTADDPRQAAAAEAGSDGGVRVAEAAEAPAAGPADDGRSAGYSLLHMTKLREAGTFDLMMASVVMQGPYRAGDEAGPMAMLHEPLATEVRRVH